MLLRGIGGGKPKLANLISRLEEIMRPYQETFTRVRRYSLGYNGGGEVFTRVRRYSLGYNGGGEVFTRIRKFSTIYVSDVTV